MSDEIDSLIQSHTGIVVVHLTEPILETDQQADWVMSEIREWVGAARMVRLEISLHREWARHYRVHGAPCTLVFRNGQLYLRTKGRINRTRFLAALKRVGLIQ